VLVRTYRIVVRLEDSNDVLKNVIGALIRRIVLPFYHFSFTEGV
jgi:hypothetical protein